jgi:hypothetical protein
MTSNPSPQASDHPEFPPIMRLQIRNQTRKRRSSFTSFHRIVSVSDKRILRLANYRLLFTLSYFSKAPRKPSSCPRCTMQDIILFLSRDNLTDEALRTVRRPFYFFFV